MHSHESQCKRILRCLESHKLVPLPAIMNLKTGAWPFRHRIANHTARISQLRRKISPDRGIKNIKQWDRVKKCYVSFYRLYDIKQEPTQTSDVIKSYKDTLH